MTEDDKVQSKKKFRLRNAVVAGVVLGKGDRVMVYHDVLQRKWIGERPQFCRNLDMFDTDSLVVI